MRCSASVRLAALWLALATSSAAGSASPRFGVLTAGGDDDATAVRAGLDEALHVAGLGEDRVDRVAPSGAPEARAAIEELRHEGVQLVVAVGDAASILAHASVRDRTVVCVTLDPGRTAQFLRGGGACVVTGAPADRIARDLRRVTQTPGRVGVFVPAGDEAARTNADDLASIANVVRATAMGATPDERAESVVGQFVAGADLVWVPPSVPAADAAALARALVGRRLPLVGSRAAHLAAGCSVVVRTDPRDLGALAAVVAKEVLAGADPGKIGARHVRSMLLEVNLPAASRLNAPVPLELLAWADLILPLRSVPAVPR